MRTLRGLRSAVAMVALIALAGAPLGAVTRGPDAGGYTATDVTVYSFVDVSGAGGAAVLAGNDDGVAALTLPFPFVFYGQSYSLACVSTNGALYFVTSAASCTGVNDIGNVDLALTTPNDWPALFPFWSDLTFQAPGAGAVYYQTVGAPGSRRFVVQWNAAYPILSSGLSASPVTFQIVLSEGTNTVLFQYKTIVLSGGNAASAGGLATVGVRNSGPATDQKQIQWSYDSPVLHDQSALLFTTTLTPTLTMANATVVYDGNPHALAPSLTGVNHETLGPVTLTYSGNSTAPTQVGSYPVVASYAGNGTYAPASANATLTINPATPVITWANPADITYGTALGGTQLNATANVAGTSFAYTPAAGTVLNAAAGQVLSVNFTPADTTNYTTASTTVHLNVLKATPAATLAVSNSPVTYNGLPHAAAVTVASSSVPGSVTNVMTGGAATKTTAGAYAVTADFVPTDLTNYATLTGRPAGNFVIDQATPVISWANPADIAQGTALGAAQLNATANVSGTFAYTPPAGTVLPLGNGQTLGTTFTPTDTVNYQTATASAVINVVAPTGLPGRFLGAGGVDTQAAQTRFLFEVRTDTVTDRGRLTLRTRPNRPAGRDGDDDRDDRFGPWHRFASTSITRATASNTPGVSPGSRPSSGVDTIAFAGIGTWNGAPGYRFAAQAVDAGEPGRGRDQFEITITAPNGKVVLNVSGTIGSGNIQSLPTR